MAARSAGARTWHWHRLRPLVRGLPGRLNQRFSLHVVRLQRSHLSASACTSCTNSDTLSIDRFGSEYICTLTD